MKKDFQGVAQNIMEQYLPGENKVNTKEKAQLCCWIDADLMQAVKVESAKCNIKINAIVSEALQNYLAR